MTQDDPMLRLTYYKETGQADEAAQYEKYLRETGQWKEPSKRLGAPRIPVAQAESTRALDRNRPNASGDFEAVAPAVAANLASAAQIIPGMEAIQAKASSLANRMSYKDALAMQRRETDAIPAPIKVAGRMLAAGPLMAAMPANPAVAGAVLGGADQALDADPERGLGSRVLGGAAGAAVGGVVGAGVDAAVTKARALKAAPSAKVVRQLKKTRAEETGPMFDAAMSEGQMAPATKEVMAFVSKPDVKEIIKGLRATREFANVSETSPEMLDAVYKVLSDQSAQVKRGLEAATPNRPNIGRFRARDIRAAKDEGLAAMDTPMPSYRPAVKTYADHSQGIDAVRKGQDAVRGTVQKGITTGKNLDRTTQDAFESWLTTATPAEREMAEKGVLGATKQATKGGHPIKAMGALLKTPSLLRATKTKQQQAIDALIKAGLLGLNAAVPH